MTQRKTARGAMVCRLGSGEVVKVCHSAGTSLRWGTCGQGEWTVESGGVALRLQWAVRMARDRQHAD